MPRAWKGGLCALAALALTACGVLPPSERVHVHEPPAPGLSLVELRFGYANSFLIYRQDDPSTAVLIDAGFPDDAPALRAAIETAGVDPADLDALIVTHGHSDHAGGAEYFRDRFGTPVIAGAGDLALIDGRAADNLCPTSLLARIASWTLPSDGAWHFTPGTALGPEDRLDGVGGLPIRVIALPGHTEGSLIVLAGDAVFAGDLIRGRIFGQGPARHFFMCDLADNDRDLAALARGIAPEASRIYPGHFDAFSMDALRGFAGVKPPSDQ